MTEQLTLEERATNYETMLHIRQVNKNLNTVIREFLTRSELHDQTKLESPEVESFTEVTKDLHGLTYGSPEYHANRDRIKPALDHHYANNRHHPEHFPNGINDMNIIDIVEMFSDWAASCKRHADGNLRKSIEHNANRYNIAPQLVKIFENSIGLFEKENQ